MPSKCPHCQQPIASSDPGSDQFCLFCGKPVNQEEPEKTVVAEKPDTRFGWIVLAVGAVWLAWFFVPFGQRGCDEFVMAWDLLADKEGMARLVAWPLFASLALLTIGLAAPLPDSWRSGLGAFAGFIGLFGLVPNGVHGGPFGPDLAFMLRGGLPWVLMFGLIGLGLWLRLTTPASRLARIWSGLGMACGLLAYLLPADGERSMLAALLYGLPDDGPLSMATRLVLLLPLFGLLLAAVGFLPDEEAVTVHRRWFRLNAIGALAYLPAVLLLYGLMVSLAEDSYFFLLFFGRLALLVAGAWLVIGPAAVHVSRAAERWLREFWPNRTREQSKQAGAKTESDG